VLSQQDFRGFFCEWFPSRENGDGRRTITMSSPTSRHEAVTGAVGPHPSFIQVAKPYVFEHKIRDSMAMTGVKEAKEDSMRLQGISWIDSVRKALQLYNTLSMLSKLHLNNADKTT
jgi:hypothetical protein